MAIKTVLGIVTFPDRDEAEKVSRILLEKKLAACCNIIPHIKSIYRWKGKIEEGRETLLLIKTRKQLKEKLTEEIEKLHSYEMSVIEFIETDLNLEACKWIEKETS